jgi:hypothetical protein
VDRQVWLAFTDVPPITVQFTKQTQKSFTFNSDFSGEPRATSVAMSLRLFGITKPGMAALASCVAILWTCFGLEIATRRQTSHDAAATLRTLAELRHRTQDSTGTTPVRVPAPTASPRTFTS